MACAWGGRVSLHSPKNILHYVRVGGLVVTAYRRKHKSTQWCHLLSATDNNVQCAGPMVG